MKKTGDSNSSQALWGNLLEILSEFRDAERIIEGTSGRTMRGIRSLIIDFLCERDELDHYLSKRRRTKIYSSLNHELLDKFEEHLAESDEALQIDRASCNQQAIELSDLLFGDNFKNLIDLYLKTFGSDEWGWKQIQKTFFPSVDLLSLRFAYSRSLVRAPSNVIPPKRWEMDEDFILIEELEKHGPSRRGLHGIHTRLEEQRSLDEIKQRVKSLCEELHSVNNSTKAKAVKR